MTMEKMESLSMDSDLLPGPNKDSHDGDSLYFGENDSGINLLLPLSQFLRNECADAAHLTLIKGFGDSEYIKKDWKDKNGLFYDFLKEIHRLGRKGNAKHQPSVRYNQIHNLLENESVLIKITTQDLRDKNTEKCKILRDLDIAFVLNIMANENLKIMLNYPEAVYGAVIQIKETRTKIFHSKLNYCKSQFHQHFQELIQATETLLQYVYPDGHSIDFSKIREFYQNQVVDEKIGDMIFQQLRREIHGQYSAPNPYVPPIIIDESGEHEKVIEDLSSYIWDHCLARSQNRGPVVLCGPTGSGKSTVLKNLTMSSVNEGRCELVLYLDDWDRRTHQNVPAVTEIKSGELWGQIYRCVRQLASKTVKIYGFDSVLAVIRHYRQSTLFIVNWRLKSLGSLFKEMDHGNWVIAYQNFEQRKTNNWQILKIKPFTELLTLKLLRMSNVNQDIVSLYEKCDHKELLTSPDMIKVFQELKGTVSFGTDFELLHTFVRAKLENRDLDTILRLGEIAFDALKKGNKYIFKVNELDEVDRLFLINPDGKGWQFTHHSVQEFIASYYVVRNPGKSCKEWLLNTPQFVNVFRFACGHWCGDKTVFSEKIKYIEQYLVEYFDIRSLKQVTNKEQGEAMEIDSRKRSSKKDKKASGGTDTTSQNFRNPFSKWDFLISLDDTCRLPKLFELFAKLLLHSRFWTFQTDELDRRKLTRIEKIIRRVKLSKDSSVTIKLESGRDVRQLIAVWNKLRNIESLHNCTFVRISIKDVTGFPVIERDYLTDLCNTLARSISPIYITTYRGPLLCSSIPEFLKCTAFSRLVEADVTVYDMSSLCEILKCDRLEYLKDISVNVDLQRLEQHLTDVKTFSVPAHSSLMFRVKYFDDIQKFLDRAISPCNLKSLSIYDVYVNKNFSIDMRAFKNMEKLSLICEPHTEYPCNSRLTYEENNLPGIGLKNMEVEGNCSYTTPDNKVPRQSWMMPITMNIKPPIKLKRLLFRNTDFFDNSNKHFLDILEKHNLQKIVILDSYLSLKGVRQILSSHASNQNSDELESMTKRLKMNRIESMDIQKLVLKNPRLSLEERERRRAKKPNGKEVIITSQVGVCEKCKRFPCSCSKQIRLDSVDTFDDLVFLIEDVYEYDIVSFNYSSPVVTVRKDVCGDVRVHCALPGLSDSSVSEHLASTDSYLSRIFLMLTLAQCICLEQTSLTFEGVKKIIDHLKNLKTEYSLANKLEPFSLMIRSTYHPSTENVISSFITDIQNEKDTFTSFNFWCSCENKCFKIKKTHAGKILCNDRIFQNKL